MHTHQRLLQLVAPLIMLAACSDALTGPKAPGPVPLAPASLAKFVACEGEEGCDYNLYVPTYIRTSVCSRRRTSRIRSVTRGSTRAKRRMRGTLIHATT